jgi:hypothetical protein
MTVSKTTNTVFRGTSQGNVGAVPSLQATITTTTNWSVPEGINSVYAVVVGAGSGGAWGARTNLDAYGGRGGAGGWVGGSQIPVTTGGSLSITIGAGGSGGTGTTQVVGNAGGVTQVQSGSFRFYANGAGTTTPSSGTTDMGSSQQNSVSGGTAAVTTSAFTPNFSNINYVASIGRGSGALVGAYWETQVTSVNRFGNGDVATYSGGGGASRHRPGWGAPGPTAGGGGGGNGNNTTYGGFSPSYTGGISGNNGGGGGGAGYLGNGGAATGGFGGSGGLGGGGGGGGAANADGTSRGGAGGQGAVLIYY